MDKLVWCALNWKTKQQLLPAPYYELRHHLILLPQPSDYHTTKQHLLPASYMNWGTILYYYLNPQIITLQNNTCCQHLIWTEAPSCIITSTLRLSHYKTTPVASILLWTEAPSCIITSTLRLSHYKTTPVASILYELRYHLIITSTFRLSHSDDPWNRMNPYHLSLNGSEQDTSGCKWECVPVSQSVGGALIELTVAWERGKGQLEPFRLFCCAWSALQKQVYYIML